MRALLICCLLMPLTVRAQFTYELDQSIQVRDLNDTPLSMPWAGGLNAAQYSTMDLNQDGRDDLVLFDRTANKVITFLNQNDAYIPAPDYESLFPQDITNWVLLQDYNCDGLKDLFTGNSLGIKVYENISAPGGLLQWRHVRFYTGTGDSDVLLTKGFSGKINVQLQFDDLPSFVDADGDGDLDLFNVRFVGTGTIEYHQNFGMERYGSCDSLDFERQTQKWGGVMECSCGVLAFNNADCPPATGGRTQHAGGKSLLAFDADGDSDIDLLFSEATCSNLYLLRNDGTTANPVINTASPYPPTNSASFLIFPAAFYEDLDFDNVKDLVAIPNIFSKIYLQSDLANSNWMYKNTGTNTHPAFSLSKRNFLQESMIDVGDNSVPAFVDFDADGDLDMFISQNTSAQDVAATISLYENTGTMNAPEFRLVDNDMWGFSGLRLYNVKIQFADITKDGIIDLVLTASQLQNGEIRLYYVPGSGGATVNFGGQALTPTDIRIGAAENVYVADVDLDGYPDLLIGKTGGALELWTNTRSGSVSFQKTRDDYLGFGTSPLRQNLFCSIADFDGDGRTDMAYADQTGTVNMISDFRNVVDASTRVTDIVYNPLTESYGSPNLGGRTWPVAVNLYGSTKAAIVVGNVLGGIRILRHQTQTELPAEASIQLYPNPVRRNDFIRMKIDRSGIVQTFSSIGQQIIPPAYLAANEEYNFQVSNLAAGVYILRFTIDRKNYSRRIVVY